MTAIETEPETPVEQTPTAEAEKGVDELFEWCRWLHVGTGAQECEARHTGRCQRDDHFHAWIRLPNPFQIRDIAEKARAAKARKTRALRDTESDAYVVLEVELDELRTEEAREGLVREIVERDGMKDYEQAMREVTVDNDDFDDIGQHQEELNRQLQLPEQERDEETVEQAQKILDAYAEALQTTLKQIQQPKRDALNDRPIDALIETVRRDRIEGLSNEAYLHTYNYWQWYVGTFKGAASGDGKQAQPHERYFPHINDLKNAPTGVIRALSTAFGELEQAQAKGRAAGNA